MRSSLPQQFNNIERVRSIKDAELSNPSCSSNWKTDTLCVLTTNPGLSVTGQAPVVAAVRVATGDCGGVWGVSDGWQETGGQD